MVPMQRVLTEAEFAWARKLTVIGFGLILLAFALPFLSIPLGYRTAGGAGQDVGRGMGSLLLLVAVSWLATRKGTELSRAKGRVFTGVALIGIIGSNILVSARETEDSKDFIRAALANQARQQSQFAELGKRFADADVGQTLTPESLTTDSGRNAARAKITQYRALLGERQALLKKTVADSEEFIRTRAPTPRSRDIGLETLKANTEESTKMYSDLDKAQTGLLDAITAVLDWGAANATKLTLRDGKLVTATPALQAELGVLLEGVTAAETREGVALKSAQAIQARALAKQQASTAEAEAALK